MIICKYNHSVVRSRASFLQKGRAYYGYPELGVGMYLVEWAKGISDHELQRLYSAI